MLFIGKDLLCRAGVALCLASLVQGQKYLLVFGDSYSTTNTWPGSAAPSAADPIGNPTFPGQTTSGGYNWVGNAIAKYNTTLVYAWDLAVTGATTDNELVATYAQYNFDDQVETLMPEYLLPWDEASAADTLVAVWCGINDVGTYFWDGESAQPDIPTIMDRYFGLLDELYADGFRNFVIFSVPPFNMAPAFLNQDATQLASLQADIASYNANLTSRLATFEATYSDVTGTMFETADSFTTVLADPTAYGAPDATCYNSDGTSCLWADDYHPGLVIHDFLAQALVKAVDFF